MMQNSSDASKTMELACNLVFLSFRAGDTENLGINESELIFAKDFIVKKLQEFGKTQLHPHAKEKESSSDPIPKMPLENLMRLDQAIGEALSASKEKKGQMLDRLLKITQMAESEMHADRSGIKNYLSGNITRPMRKDTGILERETIVRLATTSARR